MVGATEIVLSALGLLIALTGVLIAVLRLVLRNVAELSVRLDSSAEANRLAHEAIGTRIDDLGTELRAEMTSMGTELRGQMAKMGSELRGQREDLGTELRGQILAGRNQTENLGTELRGRIDNLGSELRGRIDHMGETLVEVREGVAFIRGRLLATEER